MRISDWSSDVCSSDLCSAVVRGDLAAEPVVRGAYAVAALAGPLFSRDLGQRLTEDLGQSLATLPVRLHRRRLPRRRPCRGLHRSRPRVGRPCSSGPGPLPFGFLFLPAPGGGPRYGYSPPPRPRV